MRKNRKLTAGILGAMALLMATGSTLAYFTDKEQASNRITIGKVDITLTEPKWDALSESDKQNITPGKELVKDPTVTNTGINDAFVFLKVKVPAAELVTANADGTKNKAAVHELYSWEVNTGWTQVGDSINVTNEAGKIVGVEYLYVYGSRSACTSLAKNKVTPELFSSVTFLNVIEGQTLTDTTPLEEAETVIDIQAFAIQTTDLTADDVTSPTEVWNVLSNQNKLS